MKFQLKENFNPVTRCREFYLTGELAPYAGQDAPATQTSPFSIPHSLSILPIPRLTAQNIRIYQKIYNPSLPLHIVTFHFPITASIMLCQPSFSCFLSQITTGSTNLFPAISCLLISNKSPCHSSVRPLLSSLLLLSPPVLSPQSLHHGPIKPGQATGGRGAKIS